tara:strand:+ start:3862 stop:4461 length:600 start_codon:yes stop_codon:yes gene_type:complete
MISLLDPNNKLSEHKNSLNVTYPKTINIIFGNYPYPEILHGIILDIKNNLVKDVKSYSTIKGDITDWKYFLDKPVFNNFIAYLINKHQISHPEIFQYFLEKNTISNAWGTEIKKGDSLDYHSHPCRHGILYLTKGCDLILPELNLKISPNPGDYYIFPPEILHGFEKSDYENNRYNLVFNFSWSYNVDYGRKINERKNI